MTRFKLTLEYDGTDYSGWQRQLNAPSIQQTVEEAIAQHQTTHGRLVAAGRTDAGVHAWGQVAHVDVPGEYDAHTMFRATNHFLKPNHITVLKADVVSHEFHARFSAKARTYEYLILNRRALPSLNRNRVWHVSHPLDVSAIVKAASYFQGHHDFTSFRTVHCQAASAIKTLDVLRVSKQNDVISFYVKAPSFLHHQVRNMVGTLVEVGKGHLNPHQIPEIFRAKNRAAAGPTAPPCGLYFVSADYP